MRMGEKHTRYGLSQTWRLWRHCCCRYGWLPVLVAPIVTVSTLLDLYATIDCDFIHIDVGFVPSNEAWNQSTASVGLFQYSVYDENNLIDDLSVQGCQRFSDDFEANFVEGDRTWEATRIMAYISGICGIIATCTAWLFVFTPLPAGFFWPGVLLPTLLLAFISEGSKFLFLDTALCRSTVWYPNETGSPPEMAKSCQLGKSAKYAIAAVATFFASALLVCFLSPKKRKLDDNYGDESLYMDGNGGELDTSLEDEHLQEIDLNLSNINDEDSYLVVRRPSGSDCASSFDAGNSFDGEVENTSFFAVMNDSQDVELGKVVRVQDNAPTMPTLEIPSDKSDDDGLNESTESPINAKISLSPHDDKENLPHIGTRVVSDARIAMAEDMKMQNDTASDDLIEKCVLNLTRSFQTDELELFEPDEETDSQPGDDEDDDERITTRLGTRELQQQSSVVAKQESLLSPS